MNKLILNNTGGRPFVSDDLTIVQDNIINIVESIAKGIGLNNTAFILYGCDITVNGSGGATPTLDLTQGSIYYNGEIYLVDAVTGQSLPNGTTQLEVETNYEWDIVSTGVISAVYKDTVSKGVSENLKAELKASGNTGEAGLLTVEQLLVSVQATTSIAGIAEIATESEIYAASDNERIVTPIGLWYMTGGLKKKIINIGDWNMDASASVNINHGLSVSTIRTAEVMIISDSGTVLSPLDRVDFNSIAEGGVGNISGSQITLYRLTGGTYDSTAYDSTGFNRGYITIEYTA